jgi:hypothetical protein
MILSQNPFKFGDPVQGDFYLERTDLRNSVINFLANGINVVLIGPRRFGKTSFLLDLIKTESFTNNHTILVDLFNMTSLKDFYRQFIHAVKPKTPLAHKMKDWISSTKLKLEYSPDSSSFALSLTKTSDDDLKSLILQSFDSIAGFSKRILIAFDEFQSIAKLQDGGWLEATIRSKMQSHKELSFIFSGSRRGIIHDIFNNPSRPFYKSCQLIDFPALGDELTDWVIQRFASIGITCDRDSIKYLRTKVDDTPNYVQMVCFHIVANGHRNVRQEVIDGTLHTIVRQNSYPYQTLLNTLTATQQRVLRMCAKERKSIFSQEFLGKYEIKSPAHVSQAVNSLKSKQILDEGTAKGIVIFDDPLFAIWLNQQFSD